MRFFNQTQAESVSKGFQHGCSALKREYLSVFCLVRFWTGSGLSRLFSSGELWNYDGNSKEQRLSKQDLRIAKEPSSSHSHTLKGLPRSQSVRVELCAGKSPRCEIVEQGVQIREDILTGMWNGNRLCRHCNNLLTKWLKKVRIIHDAFKISTSTIDWSASLTYAVDSFPAAILKNIIIIAMQAAEEECVSVTLHCLTIYLFSETDKFSLLNVLIGAIDSYFPDF